jgi:hypothetical protein
MFTIVTVTLITLGSMVDFAGMVIMFILAETTCGTQPPGWREPTSWSGRVARLGWVRLGQFGLD